jgi:hypothetical protein
MGKLLYLNDFSAKRGPDTQAGEDTVYNVELVGEAATTVTALGMAPGEAILKGIGLLLRYQQVAELGGEVLIRIPGEDGLIPLTFEK